MNAIYQANKIKADFFVLAKDIVVNDAKQFKNQQPEYYINPAEEIKLSLELLSSKPHWKERYQEFVETIVYDNKTKIEYNSALTVLEKISAKVINSWVK
ncbi:TPA: hypothetical protein ACPSKY_002775 [Legionella bozemanae]